MNIQESIINCYPKIIELRKSQFTLSEICSILKEKNIVDVTSKRLADILSKIRNNKIHPEYNKILLLASDFDSVKLYESYSVQFNGFRICLKNAPNINKSWIINEKKLISAIANPVGILYAKRLLKLYHLSDYVLIQQYSTYWDTTIQPYEETKIKNISLDINSEYDRIISELKIKSLNFIFGDNNG